MLLRAGSVRMAPCQASGAGQGNRTHSRHGTGQAGVSRTRLRGEPWPCPRSLGWGAPGLCSGVTHSTFWLFRAHPAPAGCFLARLGGPRWLQKGPPGLRLSSHPRSSQAGGRPEDRQGCRRLCFGPEAWSPTTEPLCPPCPTCSTVGAPVPWALPEGQRRFDGGPGAAAAEMGD